MEGLNVKFTVKDWCSGRVFYDTVADADFESLKYHSFILNKYFYHSTTQRVELEKKPSTIFDNALTPLWKKFLYY